MDDRSELMSERLARALRWAAICHAGQVRKGGAVPYVEHVVAVAMILDRLGYPDDVVIAGLLHDVVEDTEATHDEVRARFGPTVAAMVEACSEVKLDALGNKRSWIDRKRDHLEALGNADPPARAIVLADKLHNLLTIAADLRDGRPVWPLFNAGREDVIWYYRTAVDRLGQGATDSRLETLAVRCREVLAEIELLDAPSQAQARPSAPSPENRQGRHSDG